MVDGVVVVDGAVGACLVPDGGHGVGFDEDSDSS